MSSNNGVTQLLAAQKRARARYGSELMTVEGVIYAALSEPVCDKFCEHQEDLEDSRFWDNALLDGIRAMYGMDPISRFNQKNRK